MAVVVAMMACRGAADPADADSEPSATAADSSAEDEAGPPDAGVELPDGCGDGVVTPGQYCYLPLQFQGPERITTEFAVDFDDDGRQELIVGDSTARVLAQFVYEDDQMVEFARAEGVSSRYRTTEFDLDGDGRLDLLLATGLGGDQPWYRNEGGVLGPMALEPLPYALAYDPDADADISAAGVPAPVDLNGDAFPEFVAAMYYSGFGLPMKTAQMLRRGAKGWSLDGPPREGWPLPGCGWFADNVRADLDEDGSPELIVLDYADFCDPIREEYDPEWHVFHVFGTDPGSGAFALLRSIPVGDRQWVEGPSALWAGDIDADGHVDVVVRTRGTNDALHLGRGDGTFAEPRLVVPDGFKGIGQLDDDPALEIVATRAAVDGIFAIDGTTPDAQGDLIYSGGLRAVADVNGDGLLDLFVPDVSNGGTEHLMLVSQP